MSKFLFILLFTVLSLFGTILFFDNVDNYFKNNFSYLHSTNVLELERLYKSSFDKGNRLDDLNYAINEISKQNIFGILFGVGIGKALNDDIEFGYANYIYRYGICGLLIYILF